MPRFLSATVMATGRVADDEAVENATTSASMMPRKKGNTGIRAMSLSIRPWTRTICTIDPTTTLRASHPILRKTPAPLDATALAIRANTPNGVNSITSPTILSSTEDSDCKRPANGLPASPDRTVPMPNRIATKISASMSPLANASTMLSGTIAMS